MEYKSEKYLSNRRKINEKSFHSFLGHKNTHNRTTPGDEHRRLLLRKHPVKKKSISFRFWA